MWVHLSDTQNLLLRFESEPVPLVSGLANPSLEWQELTAPFNTLPAVCFNTATQHFSLSMCKHASLFSLSLSQYVNMQHAKNIKHAFM